MPSVIVHKPAGIETNLSELNFKVVFEKPKHIGVLYSDYSELKMRKFSEKIGDIGQADKFIKSLKNFPTLMFFSSEKCKKFIRNRNNMPPVLINKELGYVGCGDVLSLPNGAEKEFSDIYYFNDFLFRPIIKTHPNFFFTFEGMWMLDSIVPDDSSIAFMKLDGEVTLSNKDKWESYKDLRFFDTIIATRKKAIVTKNKTGGFQKTQQTNFKEKRTIGFQQTSKGFTKHY